VRFCQTQTQVPENTWKFNMLLRKPLRKPIFTSFIQIVTLSLSTHYVFNNVFCWSLLLIASHLVLSQVHLHAEFAESTSRCGIFGGRWARSRLFLFGAVKKHFDSCTQSMIQLCTAHLIWIPLLLVASHSSNASEWSLVIRTCLFDLGMDRLRMDLMN